MKKQHIFSIIGLVIIVIIVLAIVLPGKSVRDADDQGAFVEEELSQITAPQAVEDGEFVYRFDGIDWDFNLIEAGSARVPETKVGFYLENFTRRESGVPATFGRPFGIGFYKGECVELPSISENETTMGLEGDIIGAATCLWAGEASLVLVTQNGLDVSVYDRKSNGERQLIRTIDISTILN